MIEGKRIYDVDDPVVLNPGEYCYWDDHWWASVPATGYPMLSNLMLHQIIEHEDGTITVSPSILVTGHGGRKWHGYLEKGVWREV